MSDILEGDRIPYRDQAQRLFNPLGPGAKRPADQMVVPFLGAGVSISGRPYNADPQEEPTYPDQAKVSAIVQELGLDGQAASFLQVAILLACRLQVAQKKPSYLNSQDIFDKLQSDAYPPSAGELAQLFSQLSSYTRFKEVASIIREVFPSGSLNLSDEELIKMLNLLASESHIANPPDALTSITSYYENVSDREQLWNNLSFIGTKNTPSQTHRLLATAARNYLTQTDPQRNQPNPPDDYLIITSNYDCLMEEALDLQGMPYVVLVTRRDQKVSLRFSKNVEDADRMIEKYSGKYPSGFTLRNSTRMVIIYKIHGCLSPELKDSDDGIVISDSDYVKYISNMGTNEGVIPAHVTSLMEDKAFLFLGYSLSDWNVRSIFETIKTKRSLTKSVRDFAVMYRVGEYEKVFFDKNNIQIIKADLNAYAEGVKKNLPDDLRGTI